MSPIPIWVKWLAALLLIAAALGIVYAYGQQQFSLGEKAERGTWFERENGQLVTANAKIKSLEEQYRTQEHDHAAALASISSQYQKDLTHVKADKDRVIAGLRNGSMRLQVPIVASVSADGGATSKVTAATTGRDGETRAELSIAASEFLVGFASEADEITKQLGRCQDVINADRNTGDGNAR